MELAPSETHHLRDIIRLKQGDLCLLTDGFGSEAEASVSSFLKSGTSELIIRQISKAPQKETNKVYIRVLQALLQKNKTDFLIEKAQELGVDEFWPVETERTVVHLQKENESHVRSRWEKIVTGAVKQSGVLKPMKLGPVNSLKEALRSLPQGEEVTIFHPDPAALPFKEWIETRGSRPLNICFGPEGGFSERELKEAKIEQEKKGSPCTIVRLQDGILRSETAFLGVIASLRFLL